jgi:hypothetical protein
MELMVSDRDIAKKLFKIIRWTYKASKELSDKVDKGFGYYIEPEAISAWQSRFKKQVNELQTDERNLLDKFYKSSIWFTNVGLLYARWAEEA